MNAIQKLQHHLCPGNEGKEFEELFIEAVREAMMSPKRVCDKFEPTWLFPQKSTQGPCKNCGSGYDSHTKVAYPSNAKIEPVKPE